MGTLINLIIGFIMGVLFGHQLEEPKTVHHEELQKPPSEIFQQLEARQQILKS